MADEVKPNDEILARLETCKACKGKRVQKFCRLGKRLRRESRLKTEWYDVKCHQCQGTGKVYVLIHPVVVTNENK